MARPTTPDNPPGSGAGACESSSSSGSSPATEPGFTRPPRCRDRPWAGVALFALGPGTNHATPLLGIYRDLYGASLQVLTLTFGAYPLGLAPSPLIFGPLSDRIGRRTVLLPALLLPMLAFVSPLGGATG